MIKEKKCKGTGIAKGYGCGKMTAYRVYGLGKMCCYANWLLNSENGKIKVAKLSLKVSKPRLDLEQKEREKKQGSRIKALLNTTKTIVHSYIRERDKYKPCISCGCAWNDTFEAGHFYKAFTYPSIKFHLDNIFGQCVFCNRRLDGNFDNYSLRLPDRIGTERYENIIELAKKDKQFLKVWEIEELEEIIKNVKKLKNELN